MKYIFLGIAIMFCVSLTFSKGNENTQFYYYKGKKIDLPISKTRLVIFLEEDQEYEKAIEKDYVITRKFINRFLYKTHFEGKKQLQRNDLMLTNKKVVRL